MEHVLLKLNDAIIERVGKVIFYGPNAGNIVACTRILEPELLLVPEAWKMLKKQTWAKHGKAIIAAVEKLIALNNAAKVRHNIDEQKAKRNALAGD